MSVIMSEIHLEFLDKRRREVFQQLAVFKDIGYLGGGTALALQLNHRQSFDFDIFMPKAVNNKLRLKIKSVFGSQDLYVNTSDQASFLMDNEIGITFLWYYFKPLKPFVKTESLSLASIEDIAIDKAHTIGRRAVWRDYVDMFVILKRKYLTIDKIIALASKKFLSEFSETMFLQQLTYFDDITVYPTQFVNQKFSPLEIRTFLETEVKKYLKVFRKI